MNCKEFRSRIEDWLDEAVTPATAVAMADHLGACPECARHLSERHELATACRQAVAGVTAHLEFIPAPLALTRERPAARRPFLRRAGLAAAATLLLAAGFWLFLPGGRGNAPADPQKGVTAEIHIRDTLHNREDAFITGRERGTRFRIHVQVVVTETNGHQG